MEKNRFAWQVHPVANKNNIVSGSKYRFTVLTPRLIRMEYDPNGKFEDRASQTAFYRDFPENDFHVTRDGGKVIIETDGLTLEYSENEEFSKETLSVRLKEEPFTIWHYGDETENLGGTASTLDKINDHIKLGDGVCSRSGCVLMDDSDTMVLGHDGWVELRNENTFDAYFYGYGFDYFGAIRDFYKLTGRPPMLPAFALGNWWSKFYYYTQQEYLDMFERFRKEDVPFSVAVIDMNWHLEGWTGYTWNKELYPDHKKLLKTLRENNLKVTLNLHPAMGVDTHESMYDEMAQAMGVDAAEKKRIPFDILSKKYMANYFDILHHPHEREGVDFWWMDWQQGTKYDWIHQPNQNGVLQDPLEKLNPLWMLNHLHILDSERDGKRPLIFSRYSGPGSHRYPIGFSGDTYITWDQLDFQPYFTATASNIGYCWWSHDIGGFGVGYRDDELLVRWIQLGVLSPITRLHCSVRGYVTKEPWNYDEHIQKIMKSWLVLRHRMFPYLYTMNYRTHRDLVPLVLPMYYHYPKNSGAYECKNQYWFGSEFFVAPVTKPCDKNDRLGDTNVWMPKGHWFDLQRGDHYFSQNNRTVSAFRYLDEYPVFAKSGAIVPMSEHTAQDNRLVNNANMELLVFPGADNRFELYEDSGENNEFEKGKFATTKFEFDYRDVCARLKICAAEGDLSLIPQTRHWKIMLRGFTGNMRLKAFVSGEEKEVSPVYDKETNTTSVCVSAPVSDDITVEIATDSSTLITDNGNADDRVMKYVVMSQIAHREKEAIIKAYQSRKEIEEAYQEPIESRDALTHYFYKLFECGNHHLIKAIREQICLTMEDI